LASIPTALGRGNHGHTGIIVKPAKDFTMATVAFTNPPHLGIYPTEFVTNATARTRVREEAEHKEGLTQFEIFKGAKQALKDIILEAVEHDYLMEVEDKMLSFLNQTPRQMIDLLKARGGALNFDDSKTLLAERDTEWEVSGNPQKCFNRTEQVINPLTRAGITSDLNEQRDMAFYYIKASSKFDAAMREWENKPAADKTWVNINTFISTEYAQENNHNKLTTKQFRANAIEEQAEVTEELIAFLTENHTRQMETLIKSTTEAMKEMMQLIKSKAKTPSNTNDSSKTEMKEM
jgi:hypothetical protein